MNKSLLIGVVILVVAGVFVLLNNQGSKKINTPSSTSVATTPPQSASPSVSPSPSAMEEKKITVTKNGFAPQTLKIKAGTKVTFVNNSGSAISVNSNPHPTHTLFPFLNIGVINDGASASVTFDKTGTYTYHNHLNPSQTGEVVVE